MVWTTPFTAITGTVIASSDWNASGKGNLNHLRGLVPDPAASGRALISTSTSAAAFLLLGPSVLDALDSPADNEVLTYDTASSKFEWQAGSAVVTPVPSGLIAAFATAAAIASGWARCDGTSGRPNLNGRILVGAGTTFAVTFVENTAYGSSWSHSHNTGDHEHSASNLGIGGSLGTADTDNSYGSGSASPKAATTGHRHDIGGLDVTGYTDGMKQLTTHAAVAIPTSTDAWVIPSHAVVWAQKT